MFFEQLKEMNSTLALAILVQFKINEFVLIYSNWVNWEFNAEFIQDMNMI